ncbi:MAG: glycosyltransferase family 4 protein [Psychroserpens sp.]|uniref:glycosyltransferase family 4 protein n=1 Tax=Psychroserpens sp. TaxID=2020870 RepID=UPI003C88A7A2
MNKLNKRILIVSSEFPPQPGGIGNHAYNLALYLSRNDFEITVIADQRSSDGNEELDFDQNLPFLVKRNKLRTPRVFMYFIRLKLILSSIKTSHTIIATGKFSLWSVAFFSLLIKRNYIAVIHGTEVNFKTIWLKRSVDWSLNRFDKIIAVSNYTKRLIEHLNLRVTVIPNGIAVNKWHNELINESNLKGFPKLITVGNVTSRKGQLNVISHLPDLLLKYPELHYHCVGLMTEAEDFIRHAEVLKVQNRVTFHGRVNDEELQTMLMASDIFVMLSSETATGDVEGFGIAILEANLLGVPAIGSLGCGIEDAIAAKMSGLLVPPKSSEAFVQAVEDILSTPRAYREGAIDWATKHDWSEVIKAYLKCIE